MLLFSGNQSPTQSPLGSWPSTGGFSQDSGTACGSCLAPLHLLCPVHPAPNLVELPANSVSFMRLKGEQFRLSRAQRPVTQFVVYSELMSLVFPCCLIFLLLLTPRLQGKQTISVQLEPCDMALLSGSF